MVRPATFVAIVAAALLPSVAAAQLPKLPTKPAIKQLGPSADKRKLDDADVPPSYRPPPGMCRIWLESVPAAQQPAPTDCASAVRNRPANGRVLFGDDYVDRKAQKADAGATKPAEPAPETEYAVEGSATVVALPSVLEGRAHGPMADDAQPPRDTTGRRDLPVRQPPIDRRRPRGRDTLDVPDDYDAGYRAGYEDALRGRAPRVAGVRTPGGAVGAVVVPQQGDDPRYFNNGQYPPPGRANGTCLDRDNDGWCDDPRFGAPVCRDLDGDGRCDDYPADAAAPYPSALPDMRAGTDVQRGQGSRTAIRWLGTAEVVARPSGVSRGGETPRRIMWYDANTNALLQVWTDLDGDGTADRVEIFRNGRRVKLLGR